MPCARRGGVSAPLLSGRGIFQEIWPACYAARPRQFWPVSGGYGVRYVAVRRESLEDLSRNDL